MLNGILLCDKPTGITSHALVSKVRRQLKQKQVGHAGTLDPLATGLMLVLLGEATKLSDYVLNDSKSYEVEVTFGLETDAWDTDGEVLKQEDFELDKSELQKALSKMEGTLNLPVPHFSAVKRDGKKLYESARKKEKVELPVRPMRFWGVEAQYLGPQKAKFQFSCSKGSFVRSWAMEMARQLGTVGTVSQLRRTRSGDYLVSPSLKLDQIEELTADSDLTGCEAFIPLSKCLSHWPAVRVRGKNKRLLENGQVPFELSRHLMPEQKQANKEEKSRFYRVFSGEDHQLLALMEMRPFRALKIKRVFKHLDAPT